MQPCTVLSCGIVVADLIAHPFAGLPTTGTLTLVDEIRFCQGGSAASTAIDLVMMGVPAAVVGLVGDDPLGRGLRDAVAAAGADATHIGVHPTLATPCSFVLVDAAGERTFIHNLGSQAVLSPGHVPLAAARAAGATHLHLAGFNVLPAMEGADGSVAASLFADAGALGLSTSVDTVFDSTGRRWRKILPALPYVDLFCPNLVEATAITGETDPLSALGALFDLGVRHTVAVTMGEDGALVARRGGPVVHVAAPAVDAVDGTGAGDAFMAAMIAAHLDGLPLDAQGRLACAAGGLAASAVGATTAITSRAQVERLAATLRATPR